MQASSLSETPSSTGTKSEADQKEKDKVPKETYVKPSHLKATTPGPKEEERDVIHDTVDLLRQQRVMMVMNNCSIRCCLRW